MISVQTPRHGYSKFNVLAQPTQPLSLDDTSLERLADLSQQKQWILFTGQCPRPDFAQLSSHQVRCNQIIHMKPSQTQSEVDIVTKAIQSGNASAVVASSELSLIEQRLLKELAKQHHCEVFFVDASMHHYH
ncbi:hypothetical protein H4F18_07200 [Vibrio scophthalmi]|uniref:hypothetical protein n=1 Tax=Vibrio scophthalmi TaxID=45658 RepID=UPI002FF1BC92